MAEMAKQLCIELPFNTCSDFSVSQLFQSNKQNVFDKLNSSEFSKNMVNLVNGFSKDNYTCNYYINESINASCLNFQFDIICLTEIRQTNIGMIDLVFPEYHIFIDLPNIAKGGVALLL